MAPLRAPQGRSVRVHRVGRWSAAASVINAAVTPTPTAAIRSNVMLRQTARCCADGWRDGRNTTYLEAARPACEVSCRARRWVRRRVDRDSPQRNWVPRPPRGGSATNNGSRLPIPRPLRRSSGSPGDHRSRVVVASPVRAGSRTCGDVWFRQGLATGERESRTPLGLVNHVAKRSTWQPPVDSRPRCLGSKVSVEAASVSRVVEASCSEAAIRTSVT